MIELISNSPDETFSAGRQISRFLKAGTVVALSGTLGCGKTCLANGIASGLGINEILTSPTYTIINEYQIPSSKDSSCLILYHIDAYRLNNEKEFEDIGGLEIINSNSIVIIEWSENIQKALNESFIAVSISITGYNSRLINITGININNKSDQV